MTSHHTPAASFVAKPMSRLQRIWVVTVLCGGVFVVMATVSGLYPVSGEIARATGASQTELTWIVDAYTLAMAGLLLPAGAISDRFGRRGVMNAGLGLFVFAAVLPLLFDSPAQLIAARGLLGVGAAFALPSTLSLITSTFPPEHRSSAVAIWTATFGLAGGFGAMFSSGLLEFFSYKSAFWLVLVIGAAIFVASWTIPTSRDPEPPPLDIWGAITAAISISALVYALIEAGLRGWADPLIIGSLVLGVGAAAVFAMIELRRRQPMLDVRLFAIRPFGASAFVVTMAFAAVFGNYFIVMQYGQFVLDYSAFKAAAATAGMSFTVIPVALASEWITRRFGLRAVIASGSLLSAATFVLLLQFDTDTSYAMVVLVFLVVGTGVGLNMAPCTNAIIENVPDEKQGVAASVNHTTREVGTALGVALVGGVLSSGYSGHIRDATEGLPEPARQASRDSVAAAMELAAQTDSPELADAARESFIHATHLTATVLIVVMLATAVIAGLWAPGRTRTRVRAVEPASQPPSKGSVFGTVRGIGDRAVPGAALTLLAENGELVARTSTGADGEFSLGPAEPGRYLLLCNGSELPPRVVPIGLSVMPTRRDMILQPEASIAGRLDRSGEPVAGAVVTLLNGTEVIESATSDALGRYRFSRLRAGGFTVIALASGCAPAAVTVAVSSAGEHRRDIACVPLRSLRGRVDLSGFDGPVTADVELVARSGRLIASTRADHEGSYSFDDLPEGDYTLRTTINATTIATVSI